MSSNDKSKKIDAAIARSRGAAPDAVVDVTTIDPDGELEVLSAKAEVFEISDLVRLAKQEGSVIGVQRLKLETPGHGTQGYLVDRATVMVPDPTDGKDRPVERLTIETQSGMRVAMLSLTQIEDDFREVPADGSAWVTIVMMETVKTKKGRNMSRFFTSYRLNARNPTRKVAQLAATSTADTTT